MTNLSLPIVCWISVAFAAQSLLAFDPAVQPFFEKYCVRCHDAKRREGEFRLDSLSRDFADQSAAQRWSEVIFRLNAGEMPPKKEPQPTPAELGKVVDWISTRVKEGEAARMARRGPVSHYRLSRDEYGHTAYDLLGVYFDVNLPGAFNDDPRWHGFDRIGSLLSLSPSHVERYFRAAESILDRAFPERPVASIKGRAEANVVPKNKNVAADFEPSGPLRWLIWPGRTQGGFNAQAPGLYRLRIQLSALASFKGRVPHLSIWHQGMKRSLLGRDVLAAEDKPTVLEIETFLPEGQYSLMNVAPGMLADGFTANVTNVPFVSTKDLQLRPIAYKLFTDDGQSIFPLLLVDWIEYEGPIALDSDQKKRAGLFPKIPPPVTGANAAAKAAKEAEQNAALLAESRDTLRRFAVRAWRRPVSAAEVDRYLKIVESEMTAGEKFRSAYRAALVAILTSKNFYYLEEGSPTARRDRVTDWELASRLSFFLWSSMPDDELFSLAEQGALRRPDVLKGQLTRMLADAKSQRFIESFPRQWLQLHRVGAFPPDAALYPDYDKWLEQSMILESTAYFGEMFSKNLPLREFVSSNWTMLNPRLALHYGLPSLPATNMQRVALRPEDHRGGLLTQASVLSLTSDGTRHRPVHRGVWVSEAVFGKTPPPPPPNVEPLEPTPSDKPKATIRQQLEAHATHATCASCHQKIDPLGFAFDNFDAIGRWRVAEQVTGGQGENPPVNASGALPDGRTYNGPDQFKKLLAADQQRFAEAFVEQLATYALRRVTTIDDASQIQAIAASATKTDYRLRDVIEAFVLSELFQKR